MLATFKFKILLFFYQLSKNKAINTPNVAILFIVLYGFSFAIWKLCESRFAEML
jgi:hypothetical protein